MAIALDATSQGQAVATSVTVAHTCTGSNLILWCAYFDTGADSTTGVTYNGVAMTQAIKQTTASSQWTYLYYLVAPATGTNNIVASDSGTQNLTASNVSFTGAKQTGIPDATAVNSSGGANTLTTTATSIADNCFGVMCARFNTGTASGGTNTTLIGVGTLPGQGLYSTAAKTPAGSFPLIVNNTASTICGAVMCSFAPAPPAAGPTNLKTYNTNAKANIKTMNTNAIANVKTFDTNS